MACYTDWYRDCMGYVLCVMNLVMVVNDHPAHLALMMVHLMKLGYPVVGTNCELAPTVLGSVRPRLIFLEAEPPHDHAVTILPQLRQMLHDADTPIVALAAQVVSNAAEALLDAGADALYQNPKDVNQLMTLLEQYID